MMYISMLSVLIPTFLAVVVFLRLEKPLKILAGFIFTLFIMQIIVFIFYLYGINNLAIFHAFTYIEFTCISLLYFSFFHPGSIIRTLVGVLFIAFLLFSLWNSIYWEKLNSFNSNQRAVEFSIVFVYLIMFFSKSLKREKSAVLEWQPYFILSFGYFIYFSGTLLLFLNANEFIALDIEDNWMVHAVLNIFLNIIYFIVLWKGSQRITH